MNSETILKLIDKVDKMEIYTDNNVITKEKYKFFEFSVGKKNFVVHPSLIKSKEDYYFLEFYVIGSMAPFFESKDIDLSKKLIGAMNRKKTDLINNKRKIEIERDRALVESLVTGEDSVAKLFNFTASEIVRGMNACEEKLTKKQADQLAHVAKIVMETNIKGKRYFKK